MLLLDENQEVLTLVTNSLQKYVVVMYILMRNKLTCLATLSTPTNMLSALLCAH